MAIDKKVISKDELDSDLDSGFVEEIREVLPPQREQTPGGTPPGGVSPTSPPPAVHTVAPPAAQPSTPAAPEAKGGTPAQQNQQESDDAPVVITKKTLDRLLASSDSTVQMRAEIARLNGTVGGYKQKFELLEKGSSGEIDLEGPEWKQFAADFPEIAVGTKKGLEAVAKKMGARVPAGASEEVIQKAISERVLKLETEALEDEFPDWRKTLGDHKEAKTEFRAWLAKQPKDYHDKVQNTLSAAVLVRAIRRFEASKRNSAPPPRTPARVPAANGVRLAVPQGGVRRVIGQATRNDRLRGAMTPRGDGGGSPSRPAEVDPFEQGFRQG